MDEATRVREIWRSLGLPGLVDVHTHFMPKRVMDKVWQYFDRIDLPDATPAPAEVGGPVARRWPITYRADEARRLETLRGFGVNAFTSLVYAHKPDMAAWLNQWAAQFAAATPDCLRTATFYPEPDATAYVARAIDDGSRVFKAHVQVGGYDPGDPLLHGVWGQLEDAGVPVVIHCGSGPEPGAHTGPAPIAAVLAEYPRLRLIVAHMGMPEYVEFLDLCDRYPEVRLDTTMAFTPFVEEMMPFPPDALPRLREHRDRILFGSDFPNIPYGYLEAIEVLTRLDGVDDEWLRRVLYGNAARLFALTG